MDDDLAEKQLYLPNRLLPETIATVSRVKHSLYAGVHFFFINEFTALDLVDADLHLCFKPLVVSEHLRDGFTDQIFSSPACLDRKLE